MLSTETEIAGKIVRPQIDPVASRLFAFPVSKRLVFAQESNESGNNYAYRNIKWLIIRFIQYFIFFIFPIG